MTDRLSLPARLRAALLAVPPARRRQVFVAVLGVVVVAASVQYGLKASKPSELGTITRSAFLRWREPIHKLVEGVNVYEGNPYPNPPIQGLILWPLTELPPVAGGLAWFYLKVLMAGACFVWAFRLCAAAGREPPDWAKALTVLLSLHPILGDLSHGNVNIFIAFLVFAALEAYRRGWDLAAGLVLALAIACKVTPALFLPYFGWKWASGVLTAPPAARATAVVRGAKLPAACVAGLALWLLVVPGAVLGWQHNLTLLESWYRAMAEPFLVDGKVTSEEASQSIPGAVARLLTHAPSKIDYDEQGRPVPVRYDNLADIGPGAARWLVRGCQAAWVLAVLLLCRSRGRQGLWFAAECALVVLGMLLFSERTWKHHGVTLILPFAVLTAFVALRPSAGVRWPVGAALAVAAALVIGPALLNKLSQDAALTYGSYTAAFLVLTAAVCAVMRHEKRAAARPVPG